jgi:hypothetical protein
MYDHVRLFLYNFPSLLTGGNTHVSYSGGTDLNFGPHTRMNFLMIFPQSPLERTGIVP